MKSILIKVDEDIYDIILKLFSMFPKEKIKLLYDTDDSDLDKISKFAGSIDKLPEDPIEYQKKIRNEWR